MFDVTRESLTTGDLLHMGPFKTYGEALDHAQKIANKRQQTCTVWRDDSFLIDIGPDDD